MAYSLQKHAAFQTAGFDLGVWDQMVWNTLAGRPFWLTLHTDITRGLGDHLELVILLVFPLYGLYNGPETLLVLQTGLVSLGALPIYWLAKNKLRTEPAGLIFALIYLLYPALGAAVTFDVHSLTLAIPFLAYALWTMFNRRYRLFGVMAVLAMSCKEDISLLIFMMGLYILLIQRQRRVGLIVAGGACLWFGAAIFFIIPWFRPAGGSEYVYRYAAWGDSLDEIILNILTQPWQAVQTATTGDKFFYWVRLTLPVSFIALLDPLTLLLAAPTLLINTLGNYPASYQLDLFHSSGPLAVYVTVAGINGLARLIKIIRSRLRYVSPRFLQNILLITLFSVTLVYQFRFGHIPIGRYFEWPAVTAHHRRATEMIALIPPQVAVAAENNLVPRLSRRQWIFVLPDLSHGQTQAEYVAMDLQGNLALHESALNYCQQLDGLLADDAYGLIYSNDGLLLFKRGAPDKTTFEPRTPCREIKSAP